jgi:hypothetical protein
MGEREGDGGELTIDDLLNQYNLKKENYLRDAFLKNRQLRATYRDLGIAIINALASNVLTMNATQRTIIKDVSLFTNLLDLEDMEPPIPMVEYRGSTSELEGRTVPAIPIFVYSQPLLEIEQATAQVIASLFIIQIERTANTKDPDFENVFAKYYRFSTLSISGGGVIPFNASLNIAPLLGEGVIVTSPSDQLRFDQRISLSRDIVDDNDNLILTVNNFIYIGTLGTSFDRVLIGDSSIDLPIVLARFEAIATDPAYRDYFLGIRIINTLCRGNAVAPNRYTGQLVIIRQAGFAGSIFCTGVS